MKNKRSVLFVLTIAFLWGCNKDGDPVTRVLAQSNSIIPLPVAVESSDTYFELNKNTSIAFDPLFARAGLELQNEIRDNVSVDLVTNNGPTDVNFITFIKNATFRKEQYEISITPNGITIYASNEAGAYYAVQTLKQLLLDSVVDSQKQTITFHSTNISDEPKYSYRAFHLDVARHFFDKAYVKSILDWMAFYKLNKFHFHLTDDQGWRIQIDKYPLLTEIGGWRYLDRFDSACMDLALTDPMYKIDERYLSVKDGATIYSAFYTKDDLREIISYAKDRFIEVIPEIDMPGHMSAAIRAYPHLSCTGEAGMGKEFSFPICPCNPSTMQFAFDVWDEIIELFPSDTVHIGADEVEKDTWKASDECQEFMKQKGYEDESEIQNYFVVELQKYLESKGKKVMAWDDVIDGNVNQNLILMYWRDYNLPAAEQIANNGNEIIMTPWSWFYLSSKPSDKSLEDLYNFRALDHFSQNVVDHVQGYQACLWTETIPSQRAFEYYVFPRFQAFSEFAWRGDRRDWNSFKKRLPVHLEFLTRKDTRFTRPSFMR
jgi:hexosaminidase